MSYIFAAALAVAAPSGVAAYPAYHAACDFACMDALSPGDNFGQMGIPTYGSAPVGENCALDCLDVPAGGYLDGQEYTIQVTSTTALGRKLTCSDDGEFVGGSLPPETVGAEKVLTASYTWRPTGSGDVVFRAICAAGGDVDQAWIANSFTVVRNPSQGEFVPPSPTPTPTPTSGGETEATDEQEAGGARLELEHGAVLQWTINGDSIDISVSVAGGRWIAFGLSAGDAISMSGGGDGSDVVACHGDPPVVQRYWVTQQSTPTGGADVAGATCTRASGMTTMTFQRQLAGAGNVRDITPGQMQAIIWAFGVDGSPALGYHSSTRHGMNVDFESGLATEAEKKTGEFTLFLHLFFMTVSWGGLLPWGVAIASRGRTVLNAKPGAWFKKHRALQSTGIVCMLLGFGFAVWHCEVNSSHFNHPHTYIGLLVVVLGALQPLNAFLRPHAPEEGEKRTAGRLAFEILHKGSGWTAVILGMVNVLVGITVAASKDYDSATIGVAAALAALGIGPVLCFLVLATVKRDNPISKACLVGKGGNDMEVEAAVVGKGTE